MLRPAQNLVRALQGHNHKVSKIKHPFQVEPIESMGLVYFTYIYHENQPSAGKYTIHGWYG